MRARGLQWRWLLSDESVLSPLIGLSHDYLQLFSNECHVLYLIVENRKSYLYSFDVLSESDENIQCCAFSFWYISIDSFFSFFYIASLLLLCLDSLLSFLFSVAGNLYLILSLYPFGEYRSWMLGSSCSKALNTLTQQQAKLSILGISNTWDERQFRHPRERKRERTMLRRICIIWSVERRERERKESR